MSTESFTYFPLLPGELRNQIWRFALSSLINDTFRHQRLCHYRPHRGYWDPRRLTPMDPEYDRDNEDLNLSFEFHHDRLDPVVVCVPLVAVSREARGLVLPLLRGSGFDEYPNDSTSRKNGGGDAEGDAGHNSSRTRSVLFTHPVDPLQNPLYISPNHIEAFLTEPWDRLFQPDLDHRQVSQTAPAMRRLALPATALVAQEAKPGVVTEVMCGFYRTEQVFLVVGEPLPESQGQWMLETVAGAPVWWWDPVEERLVLEGDSAGTEVDDDLGDSVKQVAEVVEAETELRTQLREVSTQKFVIRVAVAVRLG
ncbi:hypothetical protein BO82DRAFT_353790 [Aspergillus uvarum CBS 121591]|uniref:2EXR domain-containing protein n=1 Tax=Aspergillus uvarum CBS 121591 TaxID=1448315 RepID=A0A319CCT6_9EURO|nr:hypothetical protein BO82DRAFT_353790 [Aspergillus uvarum CBS 121591]PYH82220.1 hypothetical protein BO82DRAFT_353790 [Aspergillus uvarum CBS 121591]